MHFSELFTFLGHASLYGPFDDYLLQNGVKKRPKESDDYPYTLKTKDAGISLGFEDDPEDLGIERKSDGAFVFTKVNIDLAARKDAFCGDLPFGVGQARSKSDVVAVLGKPLTEGDSPVGKGVGMSYVVEGLVYVFSYTDPEATNLAFVSVSLPDDSDREHGLAHA